MNEVWANSLDNHHVISVENVIDVLSQFLDEDEISEEEEVILLRICQQLAEKGITDVICY